MNNLTSAMASHAILDLAVSEAGRALRPRRLNSLAKECNITKSAAEKYCRESAGDTATGYRNPIDRHDALLIWLYDTCPTAAVLAVEHTNAIYDLLIMNKPHPLDNQQLVRELLEVASALLDPDVTAENETTEIARAKSIFDRALAARRNPQQPDRKPKYNAKSSANLILASR